MPPATDPHATPRADVGATIAAIASPPGGAERGVLRVSGPAAGELVRATFRSDAPGFRLDRRGAWTGRFDDGTGTVPALLLWMPGPRSYTREDVAELHLPGAEPLLAAALGRLLALGATAAAPGEFTRRAFLSGRIDLTRAEGVLALVEAAHEDERRAATALFDGGLARRVEELRGGLDDLRALAEASLDFDEADTGAVPREELAALARTLAERLAAARAWEERRQPPSSLPRVALFGAPNAGKSALFNRLLAGSLALESPYAGTTRDPLVGRLGLGAGACRLVDGPGADAGAAGPDATAQRLARTEHASADLLLWVVDARRGSAGLEPERAELDRLAAPWLLAWSQLDRPDAVPAPDEALCRGGRGWVGVSARDGRGLEALRDALAAALAGPAGGTGGPGEDLGGGREGAGGVARVLFARHAERLAAAAAALASARALIDAEEPLDLAAAALAEATAALDGIRGRTGAEDLLDRIFARFCIGK